jgi:DNA polymerase III epsilon subunit-like protein
MKPFLNMQSQTFLVFDTETSGLGAQDRPIELGYIRLDNGLETLAHSALLKSVGEIHPRASEVNGITVERLLAEGKEPKGELEKFFEVVRQVVSGGGVLVAHNAQFDVRMLNKLAKDVSVESPLALNGVFCTMKRSTEQCQLEPFRFGSFKFPKLSELADSLKVVYDPAVLHGAVQDCRLAARCYVEAVRQGWW